MPVGLPGLPPPNDGNGKSTGGSLGPPSDDPLYLTPVQGMQTTNVGGDYQVYTPDTVNAGWAGDRKQLGGLLNDVANQPVRQMGLQTAFGSQLDPEQQGEWRLRQMGLAQQLQDQANGNGPSVAGSQLQQSTEQNLQAAMAQASSMRGGSLGAAQYALANNRANIQQQAAMGLGQLRVQEQMGARAQLGGLLDQGRNSDINIAGQNANLTQQNNQFNAGQTNMVGAQNLQAGINQDQYKNSQLGQLLGMGYTMDQAATMLKLGQSQFNAQVLNQGVAGQHNIALQQSGQATQLGGAAIGAAGSVFGGFVGK